MLAEGVKTEFYATKTSLTPGKIYNFKITARNSVGHSSFSTGIAILAARIPDAPISL
jgi:hypothetical protein